MKKGTPDAKGENDRTVSYALENTASFQYRRVTREASTYRNKDEIDLGPPDFRQRNLAENRTRVTLITSPCDLRRHVQLAMRWAESACQ